MPLSKEDYFLSLVVDMDNSKAQAAFQQLQKSLSDVKTAEAAAGSVTTVKERIEKEKELAEIKHKLLLEELRIQGDPAAIREKQRRERELLEVRRSVSRSEAGQRGLAGAGFAMAGAAGGAVGGAVSGAADMAAKGVQGLGSALGSLSGTLGPLNLGFSALDLALPGVGTGMKVVTESLTKMASVASPAVFDQFSKAIDDVLGVIGQSFLPILQMMTESVKVLGSIIAEIIPSGDEMREVLKPLKEAMDELNKAVREVMAELGPMIREVIIGALGGLAWALTMLAKGLTTVLKPVKEFLHALRLWLGGGEATTPRTAEGAAARSVRMEGFEAYRSRLQQEAFREPGGVTAADVPKMTQEIQNNTERMARWSENFTPERVGRAIADEIDARRSGESSRDAVRNGRNGRGIEDNGEGGGGNW